MASNVNQFPRYIRPENIEVGDTIRVSFDPDDTGIITTRTGTVGGREYFGQERVVRTREGGTLFVWHPSHRAPKVTLLARAENVQPILSMFEGTDIMERIS